MGTRQHQIESLACRKQHPAAGQVAEWMWQQQQQQQKHMLKTNVVCEI
jgi:hypothetical protein